MIYKNSVYYKIQRESERLNECFHSCLLCKHWNISCKNCLACNKPSDFVFQIQSFGEVVEEDYSSYFDIINPKSLTSFIFYSFIMNTTKPGDPLLKENEQDEDVYV